MNRRVVIVVRPRLLAETIGRTIARDDVDIVFAGDDSLAVEADVAIVTDTLPAGVVADVVVRLPEAPSPSQTPPSRRESSGVGDLAALVESVHRALAV